MRIALALLLLAVACDDTPTETIPGDAAPDVDASTDAAPPADEGFPPDPDAGQPPPDAAPVDEENPTVSFVAPSDGAEVSGTVVVQLEADDDVGLAEVTLAIDGEDAPLSETLAYTWETAGLPAGPYLLEAVARDGAGRIAQASVVVELLVPCEGEVCPPEVRFVHPRDGVTLCGTVPVEVAVDGTTAVSVDGAPLAPSDDGRFPWDTTTVDDGAHTLRAVGTRDGLGAFVEIAVTVDNAGCGAAPEVALVAPDWANGPVEIHAETTADRVRWRVDGEETEVDEAAPFALLLPGDILEEGPHTVTARAVGAFGREAEAMATVQVDRTPPTVTLDAPEGPVDGEVELRAEADDDTVSVVFRLGEDEQVDDAAPWSATFDVGERASGAHEVVVEATDAAGNTGRAEGSLLVDRPPTVAFLAPDEGVTVTGPVEVRAEAADDLGVAAVELYAGGALVGALEEGRLAWTPAYVAGPVTLRLVARDDAGQEVSAERAVTVNHPMEVILNRCAGAECVPTEDGDEVSGAVRFEVEVRDDDGPPNLVVLLFDDDRHRFQGPPFALVVDTAQLPDGEHTVVASVAGISANLDVRRTITVNNCDRDHDGERAEGRCGGDDCDDDDPDVNPAAADDEADGTDQNCDGVDGPIPDMAIPDAGPVGPDPGTGLPAQNELGPVSRTVSLEIPADRAAAQAAGCTVIGANGGATLYSWLSQAGEPNLNAFVTPNENGNSQVVLLTRALGWPTYDEVTDLDTLDLWALSATRDQRRTLVLPASYEVPEDPDSRAKIEFRDVQVNEDGTFRTAPGTFELPFPISEGLVLTIRLDGAVLSGRLELDGPSFAIRDGQVNGYWTEAAIVDWIETMLVACELPEAPADICNGLQRSVGPRDPPEAALPTLKFFLGGFDVDWVNGAPQPCFGDCNSISACFLFEAAGAVAHGRSDVAPTRCEVSCDHLADCVVAEEVCAGRGELDWVESHAECMAVCDEALSDALDQADLCDAQVRLLTDAGSALCVE